MRIQNEQKEIAQLTSRINELQPQVHEYFNLIKQRLALKDEVERKQQERARITKCPAHLNEPSHSNPQLDALVTKMIAKGILPLRHTQQQLIDAITQLAAA